LLQLALYLFQTSNRKHCGWLADGKKILRI
jgi:hypothetical protein